MDADAAAPNEMSHETRSMGLLTWTPATASSFLSVVDISSRRAVGLDSLLRPKRNLILRATTARSLVTRGTLNTSTSPGGDSEGRAPQSAFGTTRLGRIIGAGQRKFSNKLTSARRKFPLKIFLLLLGYYSANALATILGQTGDWDVLAAGILVAVIEGVGYLMYRAPAMLGERGKELVLYVNFWKSGFSFGLFVDAFKLGS